MRLSDSSAAVIRVAILLPEATVARVCFWGSYVSAIRPFGVATFGVLSCWVVGFSRTGNFP